ncbi:uncharacterized protein TRAVEDRAFT_52823 [Trametes versicolor FP-101664 SS1]|uniref:uncharacterized protein n=1 Tax=Trametes versicolor (strain FP-101664) TaxID=717944 RepID=UPI000462487D|nr:uncharacterized protein TRAVEDRAFT_52823 [Trametes versicolor FP-101664 SS1]EIW53703.1 hypothetical protein TRAVEDRAFT_52823 [Trametes versicolor FP-101664 SS1]
MAVPLVHVEANPANPDAYSTKIPAIDGTVGIFLIATFIGILLLGVTLHQAYQYARNFPHDSPWLKGLVALVVSLEILSSVMTVHACYHWLIADYFRPQALISDNMWSTNTYTFIAVRAHVLSDSPFNKAHLWAIPTAFCLAMGADLILTASLIHILRRKRTGFSRTDNMIDVLMMYSVNTGLLNGIFDLLTAVLAFTRPMSLIWAVFGIAGAKLYAITLLAALHSRSSFRVHGPGEPQQDTDAVFGLSLPQRARAALHSGSNTVPQQLNVHQTRSTSTLDGEDVVELKVISPTLES